MLDSKGVNAIGQCLDSTWGKGGSGLQACLGTLQGELLTIKFSTVFYFSTQQSMRDQTRRMAHESEDFLKAKLNEVKTAYSDACESTLSTKLMSDKDDVELISAHSNTPRRVAYYHRLMVFELS